MSLFRRSPTRRFRDYAIGPHRLRLPPGHRLDALQAQWRAYDRALADIARTTFGKYPGAAAIDIGANIGDSAAVISTHVRPPVLCIEGTAVFLPLLHENAARIGPQVRICEAFVGVEGEYLDPAGAKVADGTASAVTAVRNRPDEHSVATRSLARIVAEAQPPLPPVKLLKTDTDGFDFRILLGALDWLRAERPVLFFEYDPAFSADGDAEALACVAALAAAGYRHFLVYDNFGNFLLSTRSPARFEELNAYLRSNRRNGVAVYYFDICALAEDDADLADALRRAALDAPASAPRG